MNLKVRKCLMFVLFVVASLSLSKVYAVSPCPNPTVSPEVPKSTLLNLASLRSAVVISYGNNEGVYPAKLESLVPTILAKLPVCETASMGSRPGYQVYSESVLFDQKSDLINPAKILGTGKWGYIPSLGIVFVDTKANLEAELLYQSIISRNKANLGEMRSALTILYGDSEGVLPDKLTKSNLVPTYLPSIPFIQTCFRGQVNTITNVTTCPKSVADLKNTGGWIYNKNCPDRIYIDSSEADLWKY